MLQYFEIIITSVTDTSFSLTIKSVSQNDYNYKANYCSCGITTNICVDFKPKYYFKLNPSNPLEYYYNIIIKNKADLIKFIADLKIKTGILTKEINHIINYILINSNVSGRPNCENQCSDI